MDKVKIGIIGIGNMGSAHIVSIGTLKTCEVTAVCDINPAAFARIDPAVAGKVARYTDPETFMREADIDAVIVAVPHYSHPDLAILALEHGKHIIVEKPIAVHVAEARRLLDAGARHPELKQSAMFNQRTLPAHRKIKELIDSGELGEIRRVNWIITDWFRSQCYYDSGDWRASWRGEGGGVLLNQCPHQLDLMQWLFGLPVRVRASIALGKYHDIEVEDDVNAYLEYANGATGNFIASTGEMPGTNRLEITADRGRLVFENGRIEYLRNEQPTAEFLKTTTKRFGIADHWTVSIPVEGSKAYANQHRNIIENFVDAILHDKPLIAPLAEGIRGLELGNAILLSGLKNETVSLPIDAADYADRLQKLVATSRYVKKAPAAPVGDAIGFSDSF